MFRPGLEPVSFAVAAVLSTIPLCVFRGKSCNQILIPEAQTRWWELKSWRSLYFVLPPRLLPLGMSCVCIALVLSFSLSLCSLSCPPFLPLPPSGCWWCTVSGNQSNGAGAQSKEYLKAMGLFSQLHAERGGEGVAIGRREGKWRDGRFGVEREPYLSHKCFSAH